MMFIYIFQSRTCNLREAVIIGSIIQKVSIPPLHSRSGVIIIIITLATLFSIFFVLTLHFDRLHMFIYRKDCSSYLNFLFTAAFLHCNSMTYTHLCDYLRKHMCSAFILLSCLFLLFIYFVSLKSL